MWSMNRVLQVCEIVAALAVVLSVVFVSLEIKQNSKAQIRSTTQAAVSDYIKSLERFVDNPDLACLYIKGAQDYRSLNGAERLRFSAFYMSFYYQLQEMLQLAEDGSIDADTWSGFLGLLTETTQYPGVRQWFGDRRHWFSAHFQAYIDGLMRDNPPIENYLFRDTSGQPCS
jgi:hypothetical protein